MDLKYLSKSAQYGRAAGKQPQQTIDLNLQAPKAFAS
jgi:hypothetical protein